MFHSLSGINLKTPAPYAALFSFSDAGTIKGVPASTRPGNLFVGGLLDGFSPPIKKRRPAEETPFFICLKLTLLAEHLDHRGEILLAPSVFDPLLVELAGSFDGGKLYIDHRRLLHNQLELLVDVLEGQVAGKIPAGDGPPLGVEER